MSETSTETIPDIPLHLLNLEGYIQTLEFVPTYKPQKFRDQFVLVTSGGSSRAYMYDTKATGGGWRFWTLT